MPINKNELTMERVRKALSGFSVCLLLLLFCGSSALAAEIFRETVPLERNRVPLRLERYVEKDGKRKQPLLLVHGVTYSSHEFDVDYKDYSLARYFAGHGFEVWLLDIAGFGNSGSVGDGFRPDSDYAAEDFQTAPDGGIDFRIVEKPVADTYLSNAWRNDKTSSPNGGRRDLLVSPDTRLIPTADIKVPTLIIVGSKDPYVSPALCEEAYKTLPDRNSRLEIIEGGGHAMLMERPCYRKFRAKVRAFLSRGAR